MKLRLFITILISKIVMKVLRILRRGGTTLPGKIALKLYPGIAAVFSKNFRIIMVTGTNGKTTTSRIIGEILNECNIKYIANKSGANLPKGIVSTFIENVNIFGKCDASTALFEIDEAAFYVMCNFMEPDVLVVTNFFRDQLDRYGELYTTLNAVKNGIEKLKNTTLVLNADDSLCASLSMNNQDRKIIYYGMDKEVAVYNDESINSDALFCINCGSKYEYESRTYGHLGWFKCFDCGYSRPYTQVTCTNVRELKPTHSTIDFTIECSDKSLLYTAKINLPGLYNVYNALASIALSVVLDIPTQNTIKALSSFECGFGRMETIKTDGKYIKVILVKNPTGFNQVLNYLLTEEKHFQIAFAINDNIADGTDISWLWDVNLEVLSEIAQKIDIMYTTGIRAEDMAVRLKYSDLDSGKIKIIKDYNELINTALFCMSTDHCLYILPTYTAMLDIRDLLKNKYDLKEFWE